MEGMESPRTHVLSATRRGRHQRPIRTPEDDEWLFTPEQLVDTPSRRDGLSADVEHGLMMTHYKYMHECARGLKIPQLTVAVSIKFFQQFYMLESMVKHRPHEVAAACLFLACKVSETHRKIKDVIFHTVKMRTGAVLGDDVVEGTERYKEEKRALLLKERDVLRMLNFRLHVDHPYKYMFELCKAYFGQHTAEYREVLQLAFNFANDSFQTYLHISYDEREIASVAVLLAAGVKQYELASSPQRPGGDRNLPEFLEYYGCDIDRICSIGNTMLELYECNKKPG
eukprot:Plantae.Rhodophyta-Rhodochaete_pulchella.ctg1158.p1 GENE.Plantae.Rhodophyta-Rhodochaete_pulchella.ctg1158~~Plantae.Rhodophyta-Rhodochaete_pulchella.ctg1158.p1  ORF type:complete len:292 (+),score=41.34 Plantae.Rhodophyta-Rhodochaete_pulchella.ctg1158:27-878(+)